MAALEAFLRKQLRHNVGPQRLGNHNAAVSLLIVLDDRHPGPADGQAASVQSVDELSLVLAFRTVADIRPPRLIRFKIRARRNLAKQLLPRQPDFDVIRLRRRWTHIASTQGHGAIVQAELLKDGLSVLRQFLVLFVRILRPCELYQFHLLKLMLPDDAAHIFAIGSRLAAEAWSVSGE